MKDLKMTVLWFWHACFVGMAAIIIAAYNVLHCKKVDKIISKNDEVYVAEKFFTTR